MARAYARNHREGHSRSHQARSSEQRQNRQHWLRFHISLGAESQGFVGRWPKPPTAHGQLTPDAEDDKRRGRDQITSERDSVAAG